jgi:hypothetical protein
MITSNPISINKSASDNFINLKPESVSSSPDRMKIMNSLNVAKELEREWKKLVFSLKTQLNGSIYSSII